MYEARRRPGAAALHGGDPEADPGARRPPVALGGEFGRLRREVREGHGMLRPCELFGERAEVPWAAAGGQRVHGAGDASELQGEPQRGACQGRGGHPLHGGGPRLQELACQGGA